jgi:putative flippase GtrA
MVRSRILSFIDYCYYPFRKLMPIQTFRYAACGGGNTLLDVVIYYFAFNYLQIHQIPVVYTPAGAISAHIAAFLMAFSISFPSGYLLNRFIVFPGSILRGRVQLFRYFVLVVLCIFLNYIFLKLFVEQFHIYPPLAKVFTTVVVVSFSYVTQKKFTFKTGDPISEG